MREEVSMERKILKLILAELQQSSVLTTSPA